MKNSDPNPLLEAIQALSEVVAKNNLYVERASLIPAQETESNYDQSGTATVISTQPRSTNIFCVRRIATFVPVGANGLLNLDGRIVPVPGGLSVFGWYQQIGPDSTRQLQSSIAGTMSLILMGDLLSRRMLYR